MIKHCGCTSPNLLKLKLKPGVGHDNYFNAPTKNPQGHEYQDRVYGKGNRLCNPAPKHNGYRCTVCEKLHITSERG